ncbi:hypothetical protein THII_1856 [Thioploca ingrica]|uniref:PIN domain-containing protein n=1 Tax=Thioploca ingrica TaxID=40754 RepID=A0A090ADY4_9GAMM|nr:hypothetical protein THII_1856 [Thioploca ingrica]
MNFNVQSGYYWFGTKCQQKDIHFGILEVNCVEEESQQLGQWYFKFNYTNSSNEALPKAIDVRGALLDTTYRLGLKPVIFTDKFKKALQSEKNIGLVADTCALHHGYLEQAIRLRQDKATHIAIPDQVYMEIQLQREHNKKSKDQNCLKLRRLRKLQFASTRSIYRLKERGMVYYIRPPEAMVRYFGAEISDSNDEPESKGSNYQRDRLILEALRHQRQILPNIPIWLVTGDANFAIQVELEGFNAGFTRQPKIPEDQQSFIITSPYIEPRSFTPYHLTIEEFLEECLWDWGIITLQQEGQAIRQVWDLSNEKMCQYAQLDMQKVVCLEEKCERISILKKNNPVFSLENATNTVPKRAPSPSDILEGLKSAVTQPINRESLSSQTSSYLQALQWIEKINDQFAILPRGRKIIETWSNLEPIHVNAWYDWIQEARKDINRLDKQILLQNTLVICQSEPDDSLAKKLGLSLRDTRSQSILANAFGLVVRLKGKTWKVEDKQPQEAAQLIFEATSHLKADNISSAVRVDKVFTYLLTTTPLSVPTFRIGLYELFDSNKIRLGGTIPDSAENPVKVRVFIPQQNEHEIDLGAGDFLIPNESSQVIIL